MRLPASNSAAGERGRPRVAVPAAHDTWCPAVIERREVTAVAGRLPRNGKEAAA